MVYIMLVWMADTFIMIEQYKYKYKYKYKYNTNRVIATICTELVLVQLRP
jgi:hypothetical protein